MRQRIYQHDPQATLDYAIDWSRWLEAGETIISSQWSVTGPDSALLVGSAAYAPTNSTTVAKVWLSGGTVGGEYQVTNRVTTSNSPPRIEERSFVVFCAEK